MSKSAGSGKEVPFGKISGVSIVHVDENGQRQNFTERYLCTPCGTPDYGPGLAGGNRERFEQLKKSEVGEEPEPEFDGDYTIVKTHIRRRRGSDMDKDEDDD